MTHMNKRKADEFSACVNRLNIKAVIMCFLDTWFQFNCKAQITEYTLFLVYRNKDRMGGWLCNQCIANLHIYSDE